MSRDLKLWISKRMGKPLKSPMLRVQMPYGARGDYLSQEHATKLWPILKHYSETGELPNKYSEMQFLDPATSTISSKEQFAKFPNVQYLSDLREFTYED